MNPLKHENPAVSRRSTAWIPERRAAQSRPSSRRPCLGTLNRAKNCCGQVPFAHEGPEIRTSHGIAAAGAGSCFPSHARHH